MSQVISKVLSPAMKFWLKSQVDQVETLQIQIQGSDRQILGGYVPGVMLNTSRAIYQGLHLGQVQLTGENIRINIGQVLKGKPLQLLEAIRVSGEVHLTSENLQASLPSTLLGEGFRELLATLLEHQGMADPAHILDNYEITWQGADLDQSCFILQGILSKNQTEIPLKIKANLSLIPPQTLQLSSISIEGIPGLSGDCLEELQVDLGSDVAINAFIVQADKLVCQGELLIRP
ncbi:DUF2993 domain-containing protein [Crocosphaera sp. XPORK-15E]|uniref:LmeA family phospholipid-binding protein n=1 Tax=Crocosphaera sp. XPORK-15E TaxID=3110247 RepID=UPI002B1FF670|nr:DUF2993 domain-containing protein [Crocosphaera sp. XPORK-15E]MEA5534041.1 DUF2993 domain-containing protein [Crocosphaera sp. XPORK-15E]